MTQGLTTKIADLCANDLNRITPELIPLAAHDGDETAKDIYERAGFALGIAAANVCVTVGPRQILVAGGVSRAGALLQAGVIGVASWAAKQS